MIVDDEDDCGRFHEATHGNGGGGSMALARRLCMDLGGVLNINSIGKVQSIKP